MLTILKKIPLPSKKPKETSLANFPIFKGTASRYLTEVKSDINRYVFL